MPKKFICDLEHQSHSVEHHEVLKKKKLIRVWMNSKYANHAFLRIDAENLRMMGYIDQRNFLTFFFFFFTILNYLRGKEFTR